MHRRLLIDSVKIFLLLSIVTGVLYPMAITGLARCFFPFQAKGSVLYRGDRPVGSALIAQPPVDSAHFSWRPSAGGYATIPSAASNYGVTNSALKNAVEKNAAFWGKPVAAVPVELLFSSASGLDPHLSPDAARFQLDRIARSRGYPAQKKHALMKMIESRTEPPQGGILGEPRVNVLLLNCDLDSIAVSTEPSKGN